jgi:TPR repeat protein
MVCRGRSRPLARPDRRRAQVRARPEFAAVADTLAQDYSGLVRVFDRCRLPYPETWIKMAQVPGSQGNMRRSLLATGVPLTTAVAAGPKGAAVAYGRGDYATTLRLLRPLADQGDAVAQCLLGGMYHLGQGVPQNYGEALKWYRLAADQGDVNAQFFLGYMYDTGLDVPQNYAEALKWYRLAAIQGYPSAQFRLGLMYQFGRGVLQDYVLHICGSTCRPLRAVKMPRKIEMTFQSL